MNQQTTLFERLGGVDGITQLASDLVDLHLKNPLLAPRFVNSDVAQMKNGGATFFIAGLGGPDVYRGKDMLAVHSGLNISAVEFMAVLDDACLALEKNQVPRREQEEVLFILHSFRTDIMAV
jgi:hemoglobin